MTRKYERILLTGAAGALGALLRKEIKHLTNILRVTDRIELGQPLEAEETVKCELSDPDATLALTHDVEAVIHMGGISKEDTFADILQSNIVGCYNVYEGCRRNGVGRVVFASSNHALGFYERTQTIDAGAQQRPDSIYGVSKAFGENLSRYYFDKFGIETACLRIGSCFPEPTDRRMLATWLSYRDLVHLVERCLLAEDIGHLLVYGVSANQERFWDNRLVSWFAYHPQDSAEVYRGKVESSTPEPDANDPAVIYQGGAFAASGHFEDSVE